MSTFPSTIESLIDEFSKLPGVGRKTAEKYVFFLMNNKKEDISKLAQAIMHLQENINLCNNCGNLSEVAGLCEICKNPTRDKATLCIIEEIHDLTVIEATRQYNGLYHVLGGLINPIDGVTEEHLRITSLLHRLKEEKIAEVIIALNLDIAGEATTIYLKKLLTPFNVKITRLARGLPMGSDLEYADEITLSNAIENRKEL